MPPLMKSDSHHISISTDDILMTAQDPEEALLIPLRPLRPASTSKVPHDFDAGQMDSDLISVELEVAPSVVCVYGSLLRNFLHVKVKMLLYIMKHLSGRVACIHINGTTITIMT